MDTNERLEKIEKQITVLTKKVDVIYEKIEGKRDLRSENELYKKAKELVIRTGKVSAGLLQQKLLIGYARAARLIDMLENEGVVGPSMGAVPRKLLSNEKKENQDKI